MIGKILFSIIAITLIALTVIHLTQKDFSQTITGETISQTAEKIVAYVNDHPITEEEVQKAQEYLEAQSERMVNRTEAIQRMIDEKLILDDAQKHGFAQTTQETELEIGKILVTRNQTLEDFRAQVESQNESYEEEIEYYRKQLLIEKYLNNAITRPNVTNAQALAYYNENKDKLFTGEVALSYEQISEQLRLALERKEEQEAILKYLENLRQNANITYIN